MNARTLIKLGEWHEYLRTTRFMSLKNAKKGISELLKELEASKMKNSRVAARALGSLTLFYNRRTGYLTPTSARDIRKIWLAVEESLNSEASKIKIVYKNPQTVNSKIRYIGRRIVLNDIQKSLLKETIYCLETKANRAAIVLGWNFAFDYMRNWVYNNKLGSFNIMLRKVYRTKPSSSGSTQPLHKTIKEYSDFYSGSPSERVTIDTFFHCKLINGKLRDKLREHLRTRNNYAHATQLDPTTEQANSFVSDLCDIISSRPFT